MRIQVVANPIAGHGRAGGAAQQLAARLTARGHEVECRLTRRRGDARTWAGEAEGRADCLVVAGGDGTLNEAVNGLADPARTPIASLPVGNANNLARELGIPRRLDAFVALLEARPVRRVDLGLVDGQRFVTVVSAGFDAQVTETVRRRRVGTLGYAGYLPAIWRTWRHYQEPALAVRVDGGEPLAGALVVVSNVRHYGGLFRVTERARCDSGHLDLCLLRRARSAHLVGAVAAAFLGRVSHLPGAVQLTGRQVHIDAREPVAVQVDGDHWGTTPVGLEVRPAALALVAPGGVDAPGPSAPPP